MAKSKAKSSPKKVAKKPAPKRAKPNTKTSPAWEWRKIGLWAAVVGSLCIAVLMIGWPVITRLIEQRETVNFGIAEVRSVDRVTVEGKTSQQIVLRTHDGRRAVILEPLGETYEVGDQLCISKIKGAVTEIITYALTDPLRCGR